MTSQAAYYSTILFSTPSFLEGVARLIDVRGTLNQYNVSPTPEMADARALYADWSALGADLRSAMRQVDPDLLEQHQHELRVYLEELRANLQRFLDSPSASTEEIDELRVALERFIETVETTGGDRQAIGE